MEGIHCGSRTVRAAAMCRRVTAGAVIVMLSSVMPAAAGVAATPASNIHSVWNAEISCSGPASVLTVRHPDEAALKASGQVAIGDTGYSFTVPQLPGLADSVVLLVTDDRSRGVVDHYVLLSPGDFGSPVAAVVMTELPETYLEARPRDILLSTITAQSANAQSIPHYPVTFFQDFDGPEPVLEMVVPGRTGTPCFPTAHMAPVESADAWTTGISRFTVEGRYLIEISLIVPLPEPGGDTIGQARAHMKRFTDALSRPVKP